MKTYRGGGEVQLHSLLISALDEGEWSTSCPGRTAGAKNPDTHLKGDGVGTRAGLGDLQNSL